MTEQAGRELVEVIEKTIEAMPHARRLYPDVYAHEVADAVLAWMGERREPVAVTEEMIDRARRAVFEFRNPGVPYRPSYDIYSLQYAEVAISAALGEGKS